MSSSAREFKVKAATKETSFRVIDSKTLVIHHKVFKDTEERETDVFSRYWTFAVGTVEVGQVSAFSAGLWQSPSGRVAMFCPPFSAIEWRLAPGLVEFDSYISCAALPKEVPAEPIIFPWKQDHFPQSLNEVFRSLAKDMKGMRIPRGHNLSARTLRIKKAIDNSYSSPTSFSQLTRQLGFPRTAAARDFSRCFGFSPAYYRNRLRIFDAVPQLILGQAKVTSTAFDVGFGDVGRFSKQFKKYKLAPPSTFLPSKASIEAQARRP